MDQENINYLRSLFLGTNGGSEVKIKVIGDSYIQIIITKNRFKIQSDFFLSINDAINFFKRECEEIRLDIKIILEDVVRGN